MLIQNCIASDIKDILFLYEAARELQIKRKMVVWPFFESSFIEKEINGKRQWKLILDGRIACNWAIAFSDPQIWGGLDKNDSIYIHRIATHPLARGKKFIHPLTEWAKGYALEKGKRFVRLDTLGNNTRLIELYCSAGYEFLGMHRLTDTIDLPRHYQDEPNCCRFEIDLGKAF